MHKLEDLYSRRDRAGEFASEKPVYDVLLPKVLRQLDQTYEVLEPIGLGSTATVWKLTDTRLKQPRALKLTRPSKSKSADIIRLIRDERMRLASLNHQNIIKVFTHGDVDLVFKEEEYQFPYFVMEYLEQTADLDKAIVSRRGELDWVEIVDYLKDSLNGLDALHAQDIVHCDIKPGNILIAPGRPALIADLGYAKHILKNAGDQPTRLITTHRYAHPELLKHVRDSSDPSAAIVEIRRDKLHKKFDLFAFGRTMQEVLWKLRLAERKDPESECGKGSVLSPYQWQYLAIISKRLLDGIVQREEISQLPEDVVPPESTDSTKAEIRELYQDAIPGVSPDVMGELRYESAAQALEDVEKLQHLYDLEGQVPELNPNLRTFIQIPHCQVPLTDRVRAVINHPAFDRIAQTTQLGFVSMVYPGARHTRYEHVLGTFYNCCEYLRALWYDQTSPLFQCIMSKKDIELGLLAALLHDLSQYPMAHDLTEIDDRFGHERFLFQALEKRYPGQPSVGVLAQSLWEVDIFEVVRLLNADDKAPFRHRLLRSVVDGVMDCDKLDYLRRDSSHLGVSFGLVVDHQRLLRYLTCVWGPPTDADLGGVAEIGVAEKALVVARALMETRENMFRQVYWHHTTRSLKAMLAFVVRRVLRSERAKGTEAKFWDDFQRYVFNPGAYYSPADTLGAIPSEAPPAISDVPGKDAVLSELLADDQPDESAVLSSLDPSDDSALNFLAGYSSEVELRMIGYIRGRQHYERIGVISPKLHAQDYKQLYEEFRHLRLARDLEQIEARREKWEEGVVTRLLDGLAANRALMPTGYSDEYLAQELKAHRPLILVDVPVKATSRKLKPKYLRYVREDPFVAHGFHHGSYPRFESDQIQEDETRFDLEVGKIRILAHPLWRDLIVSVLGESVPSIILTA